MPKAAAKDPWSVPLAISDVPEAGRHLDLIADEAVRAGIAELANLRDVSRLEAVFDVALRGRGGLHVTGQVQATVGQVCVVTLEPIDNEINEPIDLLFMPEEAVAGGGEADPTDDDGPEPLIGGIVDLGAIATEFLLLGVDPYPRKAGAVFQAPPDRNRARPSICGPRHPEKTPRRQRGVINMPPVAPGAETVLLTHVP